MPQTYKGAAIPAYSDTADGPLAFRNMVDAGNVLSRVSSGAKPAAPQEGHLIWNTTDKRYEYWNGTAWVVLSRGDGGPRGFVGEFTALSGGTVAGSFSTKSQVELTGVSTGRKIKFITTHSFACSATTNPEVEFRVALPSGTVLASSNFISPGSGFFRHTVVLFGTYTMTASSGFFNFQGRTVSGTAFLHEGGKWLFEDIGPA